MILETRLARHVLKFPWLFALAILSAELSAIVLIFQLKLIARLFNTLIFVKPVQFNPRSILISIALLIAMRALFTFVENLASQRLAIKIKSEIRRTLSQRLLSCENLQGRNSGDLQSVFVDDVEAIDLYFSQYLSQVYLSFFIPLTMLVFVFPLDLLSAIIYVVTIPLIPFFMILIGKFAQEKNDRQLGVLHQMSSFFYDSIRGIKTLIVLNQIEAHFKRIRKAAMEYQKATMAVLRISFLSAFTLELLSTIATAIIAVQIGIRLLQGRLGFENAFLILLITPEIYLPLRNLGLRFHAAMNGAAAARNIFSIMDSPAKVQNQDSKISPDFDKAKLIEIKNVYFRYQDDRPLITNLNLKIEIGSRIAIVGASGSGKSTIFQLLLRFIEPTQGDIVVDGININQFSLTDWRDRIAWMPQNTLLLNGSIRQNLLIANPMACDSDLLSALEQVNLLGLIDSLPKGLDTMISEYGHKLSSGERQRIGFARILLRKSALILLDEPTSSLDPESQEMIMDCMPELPETATVITIAHRLKTIIHANRIIYMRNGEIAAMGKHSELLLQDQEYAAFCLSTIGEKNE